MLYLSLTTDMYMPQSGQYISTNTTFKGVKQFAQQALWNLMDAHDAILEHRIGKRTILISAVNPA